MTIQRTLTIAGVDPSGGAGILADIKTMSALGTYACAAIAALTAQNTQTVSGVLPINVDFIRLQLQTLFQDVLIDGIKIGMVGEAPIIYAIAEELSNYHNARHIILDPVMIAKSGNPLLKPDATPALIEALIPQSTMITPNLPEAALLVEQGSPDTIKQMYPIAEKLHRLFNSTDERWVLLKGGHLPGNELTDLLYNGDRMIELPNQRIDTANTHGTGCTLSAAICAIKTQTEDMTEATRRAKEYLVGAIQHANQLEVGQGHGPLHHFYSWW